MTKPKEVQAVSEAPVRYEVIPLKKSVNILSAVDLAAMLLWVIALVVSLITQNEIASVVFLTAYIITVITVIAHTIFTAVTIIKKRHYSKALVFGTCAVNTVWFLMLILVIRNMSEMFSSLM